MTSHTRRDQNDAADSRDKPNTSRPAQEHEPSPQRGTDRVQGEGNYDAAREYDEAQRKFVESGKVDAAARAAKPNSEAEEREMEEAERTGKSRAKEEDPALTRPRSNKSTH
jgi:hypothetical protein